GDQPATVAPWELLRGQGRSGRPGLLLNVQALRALAAMMVVLFHARVINPAGTLVSLDFGNAGVDIFFFISGFIITHVTTAADVGRPGRFLLKRAIRVVPLYWALTIVLFVAAMFLPFLISGETKPGLVALAKSLFFVPYFDDSGAILPVLFMGWTLNYEVFFYLVFAASLMIADAGVRRWTLTGIMTALIVAGALFRPDDAIGQTYTDLLMIEFVIGVWMATAYRAWPGLDLGRAARLLWIAVGIAGGVALIWAEARFPSAARELKWGIPAFVIVAAALVLERGGSAIGWKWVERVGEASYAIYLSHAFVIRALAMVYGRLAITNMAVHVVAMMAAILCATVVGIAFHYLIERPLVEVARTRLLARSAAIRG
ncbi:MAG: acyltransferase, partial [Sphingomonas bacterium]|nr:acyltransferase [Sphingomonas bacterium]